MIYILISAQLYPSSSHRHFLIWIITWYLRKGRKKRKKVCSHGNTFIFNFCYWVHILTIRHWQHFSPTFFCFTSFVLSLIQILVFKIDLYLKNFTYILCSHDNKVFDRGTWWYQGFTHHIIDVLLPPCN
jgi:hypothetical protein